MDGINFRLLQRFFMALPQDFKSVHQLRLRNLKSLTIVSSLHGTCRYLKDYV